MKAFVLRLPSLDAVARTNRTTLKTITKSTLSYAIRRGSVLKVVLAIVDSINGRADLDRSSIVLIDSMAVTLPRTVCSNARMFNNNTVGMGVLWQFCVNARKGSSPIRLLKMMGGSWNDSYQIRDCNLIPRGPLYVMDRGFYSLVTVSQWLHDKVRFLVRAKATQCHYQVTKSMGTARKLGKVFVHVDAVAIIGKNPQTQVTARLIWGEANGKDLILVSSELSAGAGQLLTSYKLRWRIERFHKVIKHVIGLAHLYSFQANGLELLVYISFLLAALIYLTAESKNSAEDLVNLLRSELKQIRRELAITDWKPNICTHKWTKKRSQNH